MRFIVRHLNKYFFFDPMSHQMLWIFSDQIFDRRFCHTEDKTCLWEFLTVTLCFLFMFHTVSRLVGINDSRAWSSAHQFDLCCPEHEDPLRGPAASLWRTCGPPERRQIQMWGFSNSNSLSDFTSLWKCLLSTYNLPSFLMFTWKSKYTRKAFLFQLFFVCFGNQQLQILNEGIKAGLYRHD